jgi:hypothetical protein
MYVTRRQRMAQGQKMVALAKQGHSQALHPVVQQGPDFFQLLYRDVGVYARMSIFLEFHSVFRSASRLSRPTVQRN